MTEDTADTTTIEEPTTTTTAENTSQAESTEEASLLSAAPTEDATSGSLSDTASESEAPTEESTAEETATETEEPAGAPEAYTDFAVPEGVNPMGEATDGAFRSAMKDANLTQDQAQAVLDKLGPAVAQDQMRQVEQQVNSWVQECRNDPEIGGDNLQPTVQAAERALVAATSPEFRQFIRESGIGNHPEFIKSWKWVADNLAEDNFVSGEPPQTGPKLKGNVMSDPKTTAAVLYGSKKD